MDSIVSKVAVVPEFDYDGGLQPTEEYLVGIYETLMFSSSNASLVLGPTAITIVLVIAIATYEEY